MGSATVPLASRSSWADPPAAALTTADGPINAEMNIYGQHAPPSDMEAT